LALLVALLLPTSSSASASHIYQNAGGFTAVLTVTDNLGAIGTAQVAITVSPNPNTINAPSNLTATAQTTGQGRNKTYSGSVLLRWTDNSNNEANFVVERCNQIVTSGKGKNQTVSCNSWGVLTASVTANSTSYPDGSAAASTTYLYRVKARSSTGVDSGYSNQAKVTTPSQ